MCIIFISSVQHMNGGYRLIIASNRDEYFDRPTLSANYWAENQNIIGGRDLKLSNEGGTWLALNVYGRFAALLNVSERDNIPNAKTRGHLVGDFVKGVIPAPDYIQGLEDIYNGFKLITITISKLSLETHFYSNYVQDEGPAMKHLSNGVYGFGGGPYLKVTEGEKRFKNIVKKYGQSKTKHILIEQILELLKWNKQHYPDKEIIKRISKHHDTEFQKKCSSIFVEMPDLQYGTRTHTIILIDHDGKIEYNEWTMNNSNWNHQCLTTKLKYET